MELGRENSLGLICCGLFLEGGVTYTPHDEDMSLQVPTGDWDSQMRALVKCVNNLTIQKVRSLANWIFHEARYLEEPTEDIRRRQAAMEQSMAWALTMEVASGSSL